MKKFILSIFLALLGVFGMACNGSKKTAPPIDHSDTTWLEIKGFKTPGYDVHMSVGYGGEGEECKFFSFGLGHDVGKSTRMETDAEISKDDLHYTLRYPLNFKQGECEFWAGNIEISMEEYNDLDIEKYPKGKAIRITKILDTKVLVLNLTYQKDTYEDNFNLNPLNLYCQRRVSFGDFYENDKKIKKHMFGAICHNTTHYDGGAKYHVDFLKKHNPLTVNLLISEDLKCSKNCNDDEMDKAKALGVTEKMHRGSIYDKPTTKPLNTRFIPSKKLFNDFKKKNKIKE